MIFKTNLSIDIINKRNSNTNNNKNDTDKKVKNLSKTKFNENLTKSKKPNLAKAIINKKLAKSKKPDFTKAHSYRIKLIIPKARYIFIYLWKTLTKVSIIYYWFETLYPNLDKCFKVCY